MSISVAIMQPYLFPYLGYFQLINSVDKFVIFDDVNFIKGGWINRNRILVNGNEEYLFTLPVVKASQNVLIKDVEIFDADKSKISLLKNISSSYKKAKNFDSAIGVLEKIILNPETNLSRYITSSLIELCRYLEIKSELIVASKLDYNRSLKAQEKIMAIVKLMGANKYYNLPGGIELYDDEFFHRNDVELNFIKTRAVTYPQFKGEFIANLSIIDVLMFNSPQEIRNFIATK